MRRGLLAWDEAEVPARALDARVARCQAAMADAGHDALLVYTNFPRPAAVSWLTHFVPYWSQGVLLVPPAGAPEFFVSLSKRVAGWIAETSHMGGIVSTPRLGADIAGRLGDAKRIGVVELDRFPTGIARPLIEALGGAALEDATALFGSVRQPADAAEIAISRRAADMARAALTDGLSAAAGDGSGALTAAIEGPARLAGAEEVLVELAPDLDADTVLRRIEGDVPLAARHAVRISLAYKGHWVRLGRSVGGEAAAVESWLVDNLPRAPHGEAGDDVTVTAREIEVCTGSRPLSVVAAPPVGSVATVNLALRTGGETHLVSAPVLVGERESDPL